MIPRVSAGLASLLRKQERGQTMVEYGLIIGLITMVGFVGVMLLGDGIVVLYELIESVPYYLRGETPP